MQEGRDGERERGREGGGQRGREAGGEETEEGRAGGRICHLVGNAFSQSNTLRQAAMSLLLGLAQQGSCTHC